MTLLPPSFKPPPPSPKRLWLVWGSLGLLLGLGLVGLKVSTLRASLGRSCYLKDVQPYRFPLARPPLARGPALKPDWVRRRDRPFMRGISLGLYFKKQSYDYDQFLYDIKKMGASHVGFVVSWYQKDVKVHTIARDAKKTVSDARLITTIHQARARGLRVFLLPIVRLKQRGPEDWRGVIKPRKLGLWWRSYRSYILHYAQIAQDHGVELFSVGSELVSMEGQRKRWLDLIRTTRRLFRGPLVYSANWDHYEPVTFWGALDYIGISNYYELSKKNMPSISTLKAAWTKIRTKIETWKARYPRQQLMFTEVGYYSQVGTNIYPWDYTRDQALSLEEQRRCYRAFIDTWKPSTALGGTFFWNWFGAGGPKDKGYSPRGKPAECALRGWYRSIHRRQQRRPGHRWLRLTPPRAPVIQPVPRRKTGGWIHVPAPRKRSPKQRSRP